MSLRVALAQMEVATGRPDQNFQQATEMAERAASAGARLFLLPELWLTGYDLEQAGQHAQELPAWLERWSALARQHRMAMAGSVLAADPSGRPANTAFLLSAEGEVVGCYRKIHLFGPLGEIRHLVPGKESPCFALSWGRVALAICYDLRFPELFRRYIDQGAEIVLLPSQWPLRRLEHWQILLRARAIENQCYLLGCNSVGPGPGETLFAGHSAAIGPWGQVLVEGGEKADLLLAEIDLEEVRRVRESFPVLRDRRL
ncbi:MAG: carbon-nitrogen family hydrolase [Chloroflexia bacterium]